MEREVSNAIADAVASAGQPATLAKKIVAWCDALSSGAVSLEDREATQQQVSVLYDGVTVPEHVKDRLGNGSESGRIPPIPHG